MRDRAKNYIVLYSMIFKKCIWARYVLMNQALCGRGMRSTECPSSFQMWYHSRLCSWEGRMPQFCVCFQILCPQPSLSIATMPSYTQRLLDSVFCTKEGTEMFCNPRLQFYNSIGWHQLKFPKWLFCYSSMSSFCSVHPITCPQSSSISLEVS